MLHIVFQTHHRRIYISDILPSKTSASQNVKQKFSCLNASVFRNMVKIGPRGPVLNTLDSFEGYTYAFTNVDTWLAIRFFLSEFVFVDVDDIELEDRQCSICTAELADDLHPAVSLPCSHVFGLECIESWLRPYPSLTVNEGLELREPLGANTCPLCREVFFPPHTAIDTLHLMEARIAFWDLAYAHVGVALTDTERHARADLLLYIRSCYARGLISTTIVNTYSPSRYISWLHRTLLRFCDDLARYGHTLTPVQDHLRRRLGEIAILGRDRDHSADGLRYRHNVQGDLVFEARHGWDPVRDNMNESDGNEEDTKGEESEALIEDDTEEMRFFRNMFRS
ncbi:hypothetical protein MMC07_008163 [Pseudocyphellaria aurata]|nr:hypothetical protein [Pseudocyphellaria aurata]